MHALLILLHMLPWSATPADTPEPEPGDNRTRIQAPSEERPVWVLSEEALGEAGADAREVLHRVPGLSVRSIGDSFSLSTLQVRGAAPEHTRVFLDGVPLARADGAPVDLSALPLWHSSAVRVWPAHAPLGYGGAMGGALAIDSLEAGPGAYEVQTGAGSFGRWHVDLFGRASGEATEMGFGLRRESSEGGFPWFDDGRTAYDTSDDRWRTRENNDATRTTGLIRARRSLGRCVTALVVHGSDQEQGVPGPSGRLANAARYELASSVGALRLGCSGDGWRASLQGGLGWMRSMASDELAEVSLQPTRNQREAWTPSARGLLWWRVHQRADLGLHQEIQREAFTITRGLPSGEVSTSARLGAASALGLRWRSPWAGLELDTRVRLDTMADDGGERRVAPGWKVALESSAWKKHGVTLQVAQSTATRFPTLYELEGDGLYVAPAQDLRDERGDVVSATARWEALWLPVSWRLYAVVSVFATDLRDMIQMRRNSLYSAVAQNVGRASVWGGELALGADVLRHLRLDVAATGLKSEMRSDEVALDGKPLPLRPESSLNGRLTGYTAASDGDELAAFLDVNLRGPYTYDMAGLARADASLEWGGGARWSLGAPPVLGSAGRLSLEARLLNAGDASTVDLLGYPRPGRRWAVQIAWREDGL